MVPKISLIQILVTNEPSRPDFSRCVELKLTDTQKRKPNVYFNEIYRLLKYNLTNVIILLFSKNYKVCKIFFFLSQALEFFLIEDGS